MSDERIAEYLRSRAQVRPPMDLVGSIADAVEGVPQQRHSWFAPFMPAGAAVAAAAVVVLAAVLVGQGPDFGPPPGGSPTQAETPSATPAPTPAPALLSPGDTVTIDARDPSGTWGTVTITRGDDVGGYEDGSVPPDSFVVEIHVEYVAEREPDPFVFGAPDWAITAGANRIPVGGVLEPDGRLERERPSLVNYPGAIDIFSNALEGWLLFSVPREADAETLELVYRPRRALDEPVAVFLVRIPEAAPEPVAAATVGPTPAPVTYVEKDEYPFSVIDHPEADALFATPDTCTNPEAGYTVTYPDAWFTNTEIGDWPACSWFSPTFFDVGDDPNDIPPQVAIVLTFEDTSTGLCVPLMAFFDRVVVGGFEATRSEDVGCSDEGGEGTFHPSPAEYQYGISVASPPAEFLNLTGTTSLEGAADYELNKALLDRIMALIEFDE